jgi:hypothetical protein
MKNDFLTLCEFFEKRIEVPQIAKEVERWLLVRTINYGLAVFSPVEDRNPIQEFLVNTVS